MIRKSETENKLKGGRFNRRQKINMQEQFLLPLVQIIWQQNNKSTYDASTPYPHIWLRETRNKTMQSPKINDISAITRSVSYDAKRSCYHETRSCNITILIFMAVTFECSLQLNRRYG